MRWASPLTDRNGRRFSDTMPALEEISDSNWDRLNGEERSDLLRRRHAQVIEVLRLNVDAVHHVSKRIDEDIGPLLAANTAATARTEAKVDESVADLKILIDRTARPLAAWRDLEGTGNFIAWFGGFLKNAAWIVLLAAAANSFIDWARSGFPGFGH